MANYGRQTSATQATDRPWQTRRVLVAGMLPNTTYHMRAHADWDGGSLVDVVHTFTTGSLPRTSAGSAGPPPTSAGTTPLTLPGITVTRPNPNLTASGGVELFALVEPGNTNMLRSFVTDLQGNIIWYYDPGITNGDPLPKPMQNGHFIVNVGDILEIDLAGNLIRDVSASQVNQSLQVNGIISQLERLFFDSGEPAFKAREIKRILLAGIDQDHGRGVLS
jgi:hypothetical protein